MTTKLASFAAGLILIAVVYFVIAELRKARGGHHAMTGGGGVNPAPDPDPSHPGPNAE